MGNGKSKKKIFCPVCKKMEDEDLVDLCKTAYDYITRYKKRPSGMARERRCLS